MPAECSCTWGDNEGGYGIVTADPACRAHEPLASALRRWADSISEALPDVLPADSTAYEAIAEMRAEATRLAGF